MKTLHTLLSVVATILTVGCGRPNSPVLLCGEEQSGSAVARPDTVSLGELAGASPQQAQFFEEREASACWEALQRLDKSTELNLIFELEPLPQAGVADEVTAGIIRYLAHHPSKQGNTLAILGSRDKHITSLDPAIGKLINLTNLDLAYNQIQEIPTDIGALTNLTTLQLDNNQLQKIPEAIGGLTNLTTLDLSSNQLQKLPTAIGDLINLKKLYLYHNQIQAIPEAIGDLINLKKLYLNNNQLQKLPTTIGGLTNLTTLQLEHNQLPCLSDSLHPWLQQSRLTTGDNPWWQPDELSKISCEALKQIAEKQLKIFHHTIRSMAKAAMGTEKFRVDLGAVEDKVEVTLKNRDFHRLIAYTLFPHLLGKGRLNRDRGIAFFERDIPFYLDRQLYTTTDVDKLLKDLENKALYRLPEAEGGD